MSDKLQNVGYLQMIYEFQKEMQSTTSLNNKKEILALYHDASTIQLALHYTYSPYKQFGLTSSQCMKRPDLCLPVKEDLFDILEMLSTRKITGHGAVGLVNGFVMLNPEYQDLIFCIIDKDLKHKKYPLMTKKEASKIIVKKATNIFFSRLNINKEIKKC